MQAEASAATDSRVAARSAPTADTLRPSSEDGAVSAPPVAARQWPQPQPPPQHPPPPAPVVKLGFDVAPCTAKAESCFSTLAPPQLGHVTTWPSERMSSSKCSSHVMHAYS
jgi:hypothetical protein